MAFLAQNNPQDDQTEQTGQMNQNMPILASGGAADPGDIQMTPFSAAPTDPNATKGTGFTNIQKYLNANQTGATNLGTQVAGSINDQTNQAQSAIGKVGALASSSPTADIWNTQEDTNAQQAITNANQKAALTANVGGQSQLIRDIAPGTSRGGVNLDQFLMQQGGGYGNVANAAQTAAGLQGDYASKSNQWQNNATTAQALQALQKQAAAGNVTAPVTVKTPSTSQVPNTSDIGANTDTGATTGNPYLGLSAEQIAYLKALQAKNAAGGTTGSNGSTAAGTVAGVGAGGLLNRGTITKTATANTTGGHAGVTIGGTDTGGFTDQSDQRYSIDANGNVTANDTGVSNSTAMAIGKVASVLTGIPGLNLLGAYLNNKINADNQAAADAAAADRANTALGGTGEAISVGGDAPGAGDSQAAANAGNVPQTQPTPTTPDQTQAAVNEGNNLTPGEIANEKAAADQAAANQAAYQNAVNAENARQAQAASDAAAAAAAAANQSSSNSGSYGGGGSNSSMGTSGSAESTASANSGNTTDARGGYGSYGSDSSSSSSSSGGGSSGGSSRVICTHFYQKGEMSRDMWKADLEYTFKHLSPTTVRGYQYWAIPYVKLMRKSKLAEDVMRPVAMYRAKELMYQMGKSDKGSMLGKIFRVVFEPTCFVIGLFVGEQDWQSLWVKE